MFHFEGSSESVDHFRFPTHGRIDLVIDGPKAVYRVAGPFNVQLIAALEALEDRARALGAFSGTWGIVVVFDICALASPDVLEALRLHAEARRQQGIAPAAVAFVLPPDVEGAKLMTPNYERLFRQMHLRFSVFCTQAQAEAWLAAYIATGGALEHK